MQRSQISGTKPPGFPQFFSAQEIQGAFSPHARWISHRVTLTGRAVSVCSISRPAWEILQAGPAEAQVLGVFQRSLDLLVGERVLALVCPDLLNGPFHMVLECLPAVPLPQRVPWSWEPDGLQLGPWRLWWARPPVLWEPRPPWEALTLTPAALALLRPVVMAAAQVRRSVVSAVGLGEPVPRVAALGRALVAGDPEAVTRAAAALAGWGPGLTPSGDDFLAGVMLGLWAVGDRWPVSATLCPLLYEAAAPRTTRLSRAFLAAARDGLADERWHTLLQALGAGEPEPVVRAARAILAFGATSGLDMLTGFEWLVHNFGATR